jgi:hypothetical protein
MPGLIWLSGKITGPLAATVGEQKSKQAANAANNPSTGLRIGVLPSYALIRRQSNPNQTL